jgi:hypothetical protein
LASRRIPNWLVSAVVMQPVAGGQYSLMLLSRAPRGISTKCHGAVFGRTVRSSSAHVEESTKGSSPGSLQYRESAGLMGLSERILNAIARARGLRCASATKATIWWPLHPHPHAEGTAASAATAIRNGRVNRDVFVIAIEVDIGENENQTRRRPPEGGRYERQIKSPPFVRHGGREEGVTRTTGRSLRVGRRHSRADHRNHPNRVPERVADVGGHLIEVRDG